MIVDYAITLVGLFFDEAVEETARLRLRHADTFCFFTARTHAAARAVLEPNPKTPCRFLGEGNDLNLVRTSRVAVQLDSPDDVSGNRGPCHLSLLSISHYIVNSDEMPGGNLKKFLSEAGSGRGRLGRAIAQ